MALEQAHSAQRSAAAAEAQAVIAQDQAVAARESSAAAWEQVLAAQRQVQLQEQMWRDQSQPYVVADVRPDQGQGQLFQVVVENRGSTIARNVNVVFEPPLEMLRGAKQGPFTALDRGLSYLPPGRVMTWHLGVSFGYFPDDTAVPDRRVTVTCDGPLGPVEPLIYTFSFEALRHQAATAPGTLQQVEKAIKEVVKAVKERK